MRYEVRRQDGKWLVWDTAARNCVMKSVAGAVEGLRRSMASRNMPMLNGGLVPMPNLATFEIRPLTFWTQDEAQQCADTLNDLLA